MVRLFTCLIFVIGADNLKTSYVMVRLSNFEWLTASIAI